MTGVGIRAQSCLTCEFGFLQFDFALWKQQMKYFQYFRSILTLRKGVLLVAFLGTTIAAVSFLTTKESQKYGSDKVGLPPLQRTREEVYDYYKLRFLQNGYPGKQLKDRIAPHPIYGAYVIRDYLTQYDSTKDDKYLKAAVKVARASLGRMEEFKNALVFWYKPDEGLSSFPARFYSGLTQSRYLVLLLNSLNLPMTRCSWKVQKKYWRVFSSSKAMGEY